MKRIEFETTGQYIYSGAFDVSEDNKDVSVYANEKIDFSIQNAIGSFQKIESIINLSELKFICKESNIKAIIYPNGNVGFSKLDSSDDELKSCYLSHASTENNNYIICVAFDETQPMLYKAQLINVFLLEKIIS
jgi:hypothetical protein